MTLQVPTTEPAELRIGTAWAWDATYGDFPADESWALNYYLLSKVGPTELTLAYGTEVNAASSGPTFEVRVPRTTTDNLTTSPGPYRLVGRMTKASDTFDGAIVCDRHVLVLADPAQHVSAQSFNRRMLDAIQAALVAGAATLGGTQRVTINGRTVEYRTTDDLLKLEATYLARVAIEENPGGVVMDETEFVRA